MKRSDAAIKTKNIIEREVNDKIWGVFDLLVKKGYEPREGQEDMILDIGEALRDNENIVVEGGVGIGKSYAYLIPAILYNKALNKPIVIATSTIILQEQLLKDINTVFDLIEEISSLRIKLIKRSIEVYMIGIVVQIRVI